MRKRIFPEKRSLSLVLRRPRHHLIRAPYAVFCREQLRKQDWLERRSQRVDQVGWMRGPGPIHARGPKRDRALAENHRLRPGLHDELHGHADHAGDLVSADPALHVRGDHKVQALVLLLLWMQLLQV